MDDAVPGPVRSTPPASPRRREARLTILLPARNEESGLAATLAALPLPTLASRGLRADVLVVDGHSTDRTREVATAHGARVVGQEGDGKGLAVRSALRHLDAEFVIMLDADHTYPEEAIPRFAERLLDGADVVLGSRFRGRIADGAMSTVNRVGNRALSLLATALYRHRVTDVCTGMWGFRRAALDALPLTSRRFELEAELFATSVRAGLRIEEVPIDYRTRLGETKLGKVRDGFAIGAKLVSALLRPAGGATRG